MKYRKKPVEFKVWHFTDEMKDRIYNELRQYQSNIYASFDEQTKPCLMIPTLEGEMRASLGDYIIRGINGEFYPCKPVEVEAVQFIDDEYGNLCAIGSLNIKPIVKRIPLRLEINTNEYNLVALPGDYIIRDSAGRIYIEKKDIFEKEYERV